MITLRDIDKSNWETCIRLKPHEEQARFVAPNLYSLAESKFEPTFVPLAVYHGDEMVGFVMYGVDPDDGNIWIYRLMVDQHHQGKGYGRAAIEAVVERVRAEGIYRQIVIGYKPDNLGAERLYERVGFRKTGEMLFGEVIAMLTW